MNDKQTQWSMIMVMALAGTVGLVAFVALIVIGGWGFSAAFFIALLLAAVVFIVLLKGFHSKPDTPGGGTGTSAASAAPKAAAPRPADTAKAAEAKAQAAPAAKAPPAPAAAEAAGVPEGEGQKPALMDAPRDGGADDLKQIKGVGPKLEQTLHGMGIYHFDQIASWTGKELAWVDENIEGFRGRASRDDWVGQAKTLAAGGATAFSDKVKKGDVY